MWRCNREIHDPAYHAGAIYHCFHGRICANPGKRLNALEENLGKQDQVIQELKATQETVKKQEQTIDEQRKLIEELKVEMKQGRASAPAEGVSCRTGGPGRGDAERKSKSWTKRSIRWSKHRDRRDPSIFNPAIGVVGETIFSYRSRKSVGDGQRPARRVRCVISVRWR